MPLFVSPMDNKTPMQQIVRDGIEIDRCPVSGGIWLDAGELEKLLARLQQAANEDRQEYARYRQVEPERAPPREAGRYRDDDDDYEDYHHRTHGRKSRMRSIFDIFD